MDTTHRQATGTVLSEDAGREVLARARRAARGGRLDAAADLLQTVRIAVPAVEVSRLDLLAKVHAQRGSYAAAEQCWLAALALDPRAIGAHAGLHELRRRRVRPDLITFVRRGLVVAMVSLGVWWFASRLSGVEARLTDVGTRAGQANVSALTELRHRFDASIAAVGTEMRRLDAASTRAQGAGVDRLEAALVASRQATDLAAEVKADAMLARLGGLETEQRQIGQRVDQGLRALGAALADDGELPTRVAQLREELHAGLARVTAAMAATAAPLRASLTDLAHDQTAAQAGLAADVRAVVAELTRLGQRIDAVAAEVARLRAAAEPPKAGEQPKTKPNGTVGGKSEAGRQP